MQKNNHFGLLCTKQKHRNTEKPKNKTTKTQKRTKKTPFTILANHPYFCYFRFFLLSHVCKAAFCWKHYRNSVFSRAQLVGITDTKPLSGPLPKMALLQPKVPFWVFPCACWHPYFNSVLSVGLATLRHKRPHSAQWGGIAEIVSRCCATRGH